MVTMLPVSASHVEGLVVSADNCSCDDLPDLIDRYREVRAAELVSYSQTLLVKNAETKAGHKLAYTPEDYRRYFSVPIQNAMDAVADPKAHRIRGRDGIDPSCRAMLDVDLATSCLRPFVAKNDEIGDDRCSGLYTGIRNSGDRSYAPANWMEDLALRDVSAIDRAGYQAEYSDLFDRIDQIIASCNNKDWTGWIYLTWTHETNVNEKLPHPGQSADSGTGSDVTDNKYVVSGELFIIDGKPRAVAQGTLTVNKGRNVNGTMACHGGVLGPKQLTPVSISQNSSESATGSFSTNGNFSISGIDPVTGQYTVSVTFFGGLGNGSFNSTAEQKGECANHSSADAGPLTAKSLGGATAKGRGTAKPNALSISGKADCGRQPIVTNSATGTSTDGLQCTISWYLHRSAAR